MSAICGKLCFFILKEYFGSKVEYVGRHIFSAGQVPFQLLKAKMNLTQQELRVALCTLLKHGLAVAVTGTTGRVQYRLLPDKIRLFLRYPRYLLITKILYGKETESLVEEMLRLGSAPVSQIVLQAYKRLEPKDTQDSELVVRLKDQLEVLVNKQYVERLNAPDNLVKFCPIRVDNKTLISQVFAGAWDKTDPVVWALNHNRFHQDMRDELLVGGINRRISTAAGDVMRVLLRLAYLVSNANAENSNPVSLAQLRDHFRKIKMQVKHLDEQLIVIAEDSSQMISREGTAYIVNMHHAVEELIWAMLGNAVEIRYGSSAARIFRLVREQEYIEQEEIQKRAMLPDKECKLLTYSLLQAGWLQQHELKKAGQKAGPVKTFFLFCINLDQVVRMYVEQCYKSLANCIARREFEHASNSSLLDKQQRIQALILHMQAKGSSEEDIAEISELLTPPESALLQTIQARIDKLHETELQIDDTLFILDLYLSNKSAR